MSKRLVWVTDIHLNFLKRDQVESFCRDIAQQGPDAVLVGGDIAEAPTIGDYLTAMADALHLPIYFVLGNHDFYHGSIAEVRQMMRVLSEKSPWLRWLGAEGAVALAAETGLVGHDSWADGRCGDYSRSTVMLNDYLLIEELSGLGPAERLRRLNVLGNEAAAHFREVLPGALDRFRRVILLTHVPPFRESCWHEGRISDDNWLPHFTCGAAGEALREVMSRRPDRELLVCCGHTHGAGEARILPNLPVRTGGATYGAPQIHAVLEVD